MTCLNLQVNTTTAGLLRDDRSKRTTAGLLRYWENFKTLAFTAVSSGRRIMRASIKAICLNINGTEQIINKSTSLCNLIRVNGLDEL